MFKRLWSAYLVVFMSSFCTLVLELVAGRILAPTIGVSLYTWTSIIGVVLAGISLGNYVGGKVADRWPYQSTLGVILFLGGLSSLAILPLIHISNTINFSPIGLIGKIVALTTLIFFLPAFILGMVSPVVVKLVLQDLSRTGNVVGKIYAFSTAGSILGTFATGFVLVATLGTRSIVLAVGVTLILLAFLFGGLVRAPRALAGSTSAGLLLVPLLIASPVKGEGLLDSGCYKETNYYCIKVYDQEVGDFRTVRALVLDHLIHSYNDVNDPRYLKYGYIKVYAEVTDYQAQRNLNFRALFIGGGGYTLPRYLEAVYPGAQMDVIEIDPGVTETVYEQLGLAPDTKIRTWNFDGRLMLNQLDGQEQYDLVFGDAFNDLSIPYHLTTREFDEQIKRLLKPDGIYLANVIDKLNGGLFIRAYVNTLRAVFPYVYILADGQPWESTFANTYVVAAAQVPLDLERLARVRGQGFNGQPVTGVMPPEKFAAWLAREPVDCRPEAYDDWLPLGRPVCLTDNFAPADNLVAPLFAERGA